MIDQKQASLHTILQINQKSQEFIEFAKELGIQKPEQIEVEPEDYFGGYDELDGEEPEMQASSLN